jgi:hypothetical protein
MRCAIDLGIDWINPAPGYGLGHLRKSRGRQRPGVHFGKLPSLMILDRGVRHQAQGRNGDGRFQRFD